MTGKRLRMENGEVVDDRACDRCGQAVGPNRIATPDGVYCSVECYEDA